MLMGKGPIWEISREDLIKIIDDSNSIKEVFSKLGIDISQKYLKKYYKDFKQRIEIDNISINELNNRKNALHTSLIRGMRSDRDELKRNGEYLNIIFNDNSTAGTRLLKKLILENKMKPYNCEICNMDNNWNGKELILQLDHINGKNHDNSLENLRFLCPNCHTQTDTYAGKNTNLVNKNSKEYNCKICNIEMLSVSRETHFCIGCLYNPDLAKKREDILYKNKPKCSMCDNKVIKSNKI